jgi:hypothetical protein
MEQIKNLTQTILDRPQDQSSQIARTAPIPRDKQQSMGDILDRWRLNQGWNVYDNDTQMMAISSWVHLLDREDVPASAYGELYERAMRTRAAMIANGKQPQTFGAEYLLAEWIGEAGLRKEWLALEIHRGRSLSAANASTCEFCGGSGFRSVGEGRNAPVTKCNHREWVG